jgi:hypothetical protein
MGKGMAKQFEQSAYQTADDINCFIYNDLRWITEVQETTPASGPEEKCPKTDRRGQVGAV